MSPAVVTTDSPPLGLSSSDLLLAPCGPVSCDLRNFYCHKTTGGLLACERCDRLEKRTKRAQTDVLNQQQRQVNGTSQHRNFVTVRSRLLEIFHEKCAVYQTVKAQSLQTVASGNRRSTTIGAASMITSTPTPEVRPAPPENWVAELTAMKPVEAAVWSKTDREILLIVSCTSVFIEILLLFILILIFCRLLKRRRSRSDYRDTESKSALSRKMDQSSFPSPVKSRRSFGANKLSKCNKSEQLRRPSCNNMNSSQELLQRAACGLVSVEVQQDQDEEYVLSVSQCPTGSINSRLLPHNGIGSNPSGFFHLQQSVCTDNSRLHQCPCTSNSAGAGGDASAGGSGSSGAGGDLCSHHFVPISYDEQPSRATRITEVH